MSDFRATATDVPVDTTLETGEGWHELRVRWLVTNELMGSNKTVVGYSVFPPGARHDLHRHPNAEEWEFVLSGSGVKRVGDQNVEISQGDIVFTPQNEFHGVANTSDTETLTTIWGYCGAGSLEDAGYLLPSDGDRPDTSTAPWPPA